MFVSSEITPRLLDRTPIFPEPRDSMRRSFPWLLFLLLLTGCTLLDVIPASPLQIAAAWHTIQPHAVIRIGPIPDLLSEWVSVAPLLASINLESDHAT